MSVSKQRVRDAAAPALSDFIWDAATLVTLRHSTLPWFGSRIGAPINAVPLAALERSGERELLSLVAQFSAHCAFLRFAGLPVFDFDAAEWVVVRKRGSDSRLVRVAARERAEGESPFAVIGAFAAASGAPRIDSLDAAWRRPEAVYAEIFHVLANDAACDLTWVRASGAGAVLSPGAETLRRVWRGREATTFAGADALDALRLLADADPSVRLTVIEHSSPVVPFSALGAFGLDGAGGAPAAIAEQLVTLLSARPHVAFVADPAALDAASRQVIGIAESGGAGSWVYPDRGEPLPRHDVFVVAPRLGALLSLREQLEAHPRKLEWIDEFVGGEDYGAFLRTGEVPRAGVLAGVVEPKRSWIAALSLLGRTVDRDLAARFLERFFFNGTLEELALDEVTTVDDVAIRFASDAVRRTASTHIPESSRAALCRTAAELTTGITAAMLYAEADDYEKAAQLLASHAWSDAEETIATLSRFPENALTHALARDLCAALIAEARYRDAMAVTPQLDEAAAAYFVARIERRTGDYGAALSRLRDAQRGEALLLEGEIHRIAGDHDAARRSLAQCEVELGASAGWQFERALLAIDTGEAIETPSCEAMPYLAARLQTYRALAREDFDEAAAHAAVAYSRATNAVERIDAALDRVFATFSAGHWETTRAAALEALTEIDESQGDRAAAGILLTLAYLAADDGQWSHAESRLRRLRAGYTAAHHERGLAELAIVDAQLAFSRGRFEEAAAHAGSVLRLAALSPQIREAASLILDTIDWMDGHLVRPRSTGRSGNAELTRRHAFLAAQLAQRVDVTRQLEATAVSRTQRLAVFRCAIAFGHVGVASRIAGELGLDYVANRPRTAADVRVLRAAALAPLPLTASSLPVKWRYAVRNRFGQWSQSGSEPALSAEEMDRIAAALPSGWIQCSDRELLYLEGSAEWPSDSREAIAAIVMLRAENARLQRIIAQSDDSLPGRPQAMPVEGFVGDSAAMREVYDRIQRVALRDVVALILGESGTGKELVARAIHRGSPRRGRNFTAINCAALPENLIESELFGSVRGAFTGADRDRPGLIESSDGGTLFLDEIGEMPLGAQAKLLRFLQEGEFRRVGESTVRTADVRIVCATNRNLEDAVEEGRFREDLFYRIHGVDVTLPPLRERGGDITRLAAHFLESERARHKAGPVRLADEVESVFLAYRWPGNVRELQNTIRAAHALAGDARELTLDHLPHRIRAAGDRRIPAGSYQDAVANFRRDLIERSLAAAGGNQNRAAASLQISRQALAYQIRELGILVKRARH